MDKTLEICDDEDMIRDYWNTWNTLAILLQDGSKTAIIKARKIKICSEYFVEIGSNVTDKIRARIERLDVLARETNALLDNYLNDPGATVKRLKLISNEVSRIVFGEKAEIWFPEVE